MRRQRHPILALAVRLLGDANAYTTEARIQLTQAYLATWSDTKQFDAATKALVEVSAQLRKEGRKDAMAALAVLVLSGAPVLAQRAAQIAERRTERAAASAHKLFGPTMPKISTTDPNAPKGASAMHVRMNTKAAAGRTNRGDG